ncbi:GNAT family N-acetyltransferase [Arthrobacter agilis]|uniref:GNAT family N-acetyltransferase n=1 Tax=Arthrobacter agilis TaxID=37921 RepID=UPI000B36040B|nr:GNAT family N-acetyltransferase [Arthrobacter agilis]OUM45698.1 GNAT family N-acetyltransferase [Arthrobacter agilis]PPB47822.1 N-acetyltransferase [Arthrobacter agilis]TPV21362.1 GNAT family N-acetyltransferase [Arthrobacter agilis]VDR32263.1 Putative ribosomal N-acetyltransferase YdaF [Arthrobacter agilis]
MDLPEIADRWPATDPAHGSVTLRAFRPDDAGMARDLSRDPYVPATGTLPLNATPAQAQQWIRRQQTRHTEGAGFSFAFVDTTEGHCAGFTGLWVRELHAGRAQIGFGIAPPFRGRRLAADALRALTSFAWTLPELHRTELYIEPWNTASIRTAERAGYLHEGLLRSHQEISGRRRDMLVYSAVRP